MSTPPPPEGGFGPMGGSVGEGFLNDPNNNMYQNSNTNNMNPGNYGDNQSFQGNAPPTPSQSSYGNPPPGTPTNSEPRMGSITQYASPGMNSVTNYPNQQQQYPSGMQQQGGFQQPNPNMQASGYGGSSMHSSSSNGPAPGSFAARSAAMMQQSQNQNQNQMLQQQQGHGYPNQQQYQQQPQQGYPNQQQPHQQDYSMQQNQQGYSYQQQPPQPPQQPPPAPPGPQYRPMPPQQQQGAPASAGSFAARSQALNNQAQSQQQNMMQSGMQQPGMQQPSMQQYGQQQQQPQYGQQQQQPQYGQQSQFPPQTIQAPQQPGSYSMGGASSVMTSNTGAMPNNAPPSKPQPSWMETPAQIAVQNRLLTDATRKVQEHAYYMRQASEKNDLPNVLDRASLMVGQLGENHGPNHHPHGQAGHPGHASPPGGEASQLNPKNYYELHMRALEDMPHFEEYLLQVSGHAQQQQPVDPNRITITMASNPTTPEEAQFTMRELYDCVQYCPQVLPRLYLQICAGSALIQSGEVGVKWVMNDLMQAVKCVQNPVRGLFLRHYLLQMLRDKLPDSPADTTPLAGPSMDSADGENTEANEAKPAAASNVPPEQEPGTVVDSYQFILANFIEMNKLWVRIQHLAGDGRSKDQRKRRERQRNELRILVGTNLVRLSQLEGVTSKIYGEIILPTVLDHIVVSGDPLAQAYLIDCLTQVFPDEYHIETLPILLRVCPKLRDKVNIRTILQNLMDRLANYLADEELLDETDTNQVKMNMAQDSFPMFEECVQNVYNARGPKLNSKEVVRLQTALLSFSLRCFHGDMEQVNRCLQRCVAALRQANTSYEMPEGTTADVPLPMKPLDDVATAELEKLLSIPLDSLALKVLQLPNYGELLAFLPWNHRREVALKLLKAVDDAGTPPKSVKEIEELFSMVEPVIRDEHDMSQMMSGMGIHDGYNGQQQMGVNMNSQALSKQVQDENALVSKLIHLLDHEDTDVVYEMLVVARQHVNKGGKNRTGQTLVAVVFAAFRLAQRVFDAEYGISNTKEESSEQEEENKEESKQENAGEKFPEAGEETPEDKAEDAIPSADSNTGNSDNEQTSEEKEETSAVEEATPSARADEPESTSQGASASEGDEKKVAAASTSASSPKSVGCRKLFVFLQQTIAMVATSNVEIGFKLYLQAALTADRFAGSRSQAAATLDTFGAMPYELITQSFVLYEQGISETRLQHRCIVAIMGTLLECQSLSEEDYQALVTKTAQFSAKMLKKSDQCQLVAQCAHLFYPAEHQHLSYRNGQRALECLQRSLKLADACVSADSSEIHLFVDLLDHYLFFFEKKCPTITDAYITGLAALIKEHVGNLSGAMGVASPNVTNAREHYFEIVRTIKEKQANPDTAEQFAPVKVE